MSLKMLAIVTMLSLLIQSHVSNAASYTVGGKAGGWKLGVAGWEKGKNFKAGDTLVFNYNPKYHNVVIVDKASYDSCTLPKPGSTGTYNTGNDRIRLIKGANYFICSYTGHCKNGMKIVAYVA